MEKCLCDTLLPDVKKWIQVIMMLFWYHDRCDLKGNCATDSCAEEQAGPLKWFKVPKYAEMEARQQVKIHIQ